MPINYNVFFKNKLNFFNYHFVQLYYKKNTLVDKHILCSGKKSSKK